eukprot:CAMPEP_0184494346 /NCGR_PEP_ID=MMETSP0113_2-20130426/28489_1 /TAXON_ID=91329 /ORGANISM="Norrisiella sphaerica, Strain BC52" /LENGTH=320 /DNA_ID=CAMNT_0026880069 /DNA_START=149 /DNA_END=1111 /DNA_ORIENTATION=+
MRSVVPVLCIIASVVALLFLHESHILGSTTSASRTQAGALRHMRIVSPFRRFQACSRSTAVQAEGAAAAGDRVKLHFKILSEEGEEISSTDVGNGEPLMFTAGQGQMMPGIENHVVGMKLGETKTVKVTPEEAFGPVSEENIVKIPKDKLPEGVDVGAILRMGTQGFPVRVTEMGDTDATLDMNHPLAGKNLQFELKLVDAVVAPPALKEMSIDTSKEGDGSTFPKPGDKVTVHYTGRLLENGQVFDSSRERGQPFQFVIGVGQVIRGWDEGVGQMSKGQQATIKIPAEMGYGQMGAGNVIPPGADLEFDVELIDIESQG